MKSMQYIQSMVLAGSRLGPGLHVPLQGELVTFESLFNVPFQLFFSTSYFYIFLLQLIDLASHFSNLGLQFLQLWICYFFLSFDVNLCLYLVVVPQQQLLILHEFFLHHLKFADPLVQCFIPFTIVFLQFADAGFFLFLQLLIDGQRVVLLVELTMLMMPFLVTCLEITLFQALRLCELDCLVVLYFLDEGEVLVQIRKGGLGEGGPYGLFLLPVSEFPHSILDLVKGLLCPGNLPESVLALVVRVVHLNRITAIMNYSNQTAQIICKTFGIWLWHQDLRISWARSGGGQQPKEIGRIAATTLNYQNTYP